MSLWLVPLLCLVLLGWAAPARAQWVVNDYWQFSPAAVSFDDGVETYDSFSDSSHWPSHVGFNAATPAGNGGTFGLRLETAFGWRLTSAFSQTFRPDTFNLRRTSIRYIDAHYTAPGFGKISLGQGEMASDLIINRDFTSSFMTTPVTVADTAGGYFFRDGTGALSTVRLAEVYQDLEGARRGRLRYDSPSFNGFTLSASAGTEVLASGVDTKFYDAAIRYDGADLRPVRIVAAAAILHTDRKTLRDATDLSGSISFHHVASGLVLALAGGTRKDGPYYGYIKLGYLADWFAVGQTRFAIDYYSGSDMVVGGDSSGATGIGVTQRFEDLDLEVFAAYRSYSYDQPGAVAGFLDASSVLFGARKRF